MDRMKLPSLLVFAVAALLSTTACAAEPAAVSADMIRQWIGQLSSEDYGTREEATVRLTRAGRAAVDAIACAALKDDLEVASRSVGVLQALLASDDIPTEDAAADALTKIVEGHTGSSADLAADVLSDFQDARQGRAIEEIKRLGGAVEVGNLFTGNADGIHVTLGAEWRGKPSDLKLLKRLPELERLSVHGVGITDDDLKHLDGLGRLAMVELFGSKVTVDGAAKLAQMYPGLEIQRRSNAMLGIACQTEPAGCRIVRVQIGSAADRGGLMADDLVMRFENQQVPDFTTLTSLIGDRRPGDKVTIELRRGNELLKKQVELGEWK
jgi:hypothetical protein